MDGRGVRLSYTARAVWTWDVCKGRASAARMTLYRGARTGEEALRLGMREADFEWDVTRGFCSVRGLHLTEKQTKGTVGACPYWCFEPYRTAKRGRVFLCGHQVCFACEFASRPRADHRGAVDTRCQCGVPVRYLN